ncbi:MAG: indolepyruvate ferredoxin oxidoreductase subunit alpha [Planctomycetota bacterium]
MPAKVDPDTCTGCTACVDTCPVNAIEMVNDKAVVDANTCTDCGACVDACPVEAITME